MPVCGPACSLLGIILSVWGVLQLGLMGVFFFIHSVAFIEDLPAEIPENFTEADIPKFYEEVDQAYTQLAYNCWIAAALYLVLLLFSAQQFRANITVK